MSTRLDWLYGIPAGKNGGFMGLHGFPAKMTDFYGFTEFVEKNVGFYGILSEKMTDLWYFWSWAK